MAGTIAVEDVDLVGPAAVRDPHAAFVRLRAAGPVVWLPRHRAWLLLDYDLVKHALQDEELSTDTITPLYTRLAPAERERLRAAEELLRGWMIFNDPPVHTRLRRPVAAAFTPRGVAGLRDDIERLADGLFARLEPGATVDFVRDVAYPLPAAVIGLLLGVPADRFVDMQAWSRQLGALVMGKVSRGDAWDRALAAAEEMSAFLRGLVEERRRRPGQDLVSRMLEVGGDDELSEVQLVGACSLLLFGGHETTTSLLSTAVMHLTGDEPARRRMAEDPRSVESAIEEVIRYDGPSKILVRRVRADCSWRGYEFRRGQAVYCATMAANRDPTEFPAPDQMRIDRAPNRHVGFGFGLHFCLGAQLARLQAQVVLPRLFRRYPDLRLACAREDLSWHPTVVGRTLQSLPLRTG
jgi:cytochrome P450